ncbi:thioesterase II family protein [Streptomyces hesseae]|uniref:Alpha/beta fold hydrolase n=1 Tax=Streptomyces hesseae TaxID=3075519 RepID=A0ABU2SUZ0_9ACTN|nr:alpha/beta fold hydrolase [Streptomyces sp. DSM 40473]MDT0452828.1 alpha/beta fold hydrolase [Streptomyces sp. DSM 40473]
MGSDWFRRYGQAPQDGPRLVCFPHAGGAASAFVPLSRTLGAAVDVVAVQYPGRQDRHQEPPVDDIARLADRLAEEMSALDDQRPFAFFGHSMGAVLAYETARRLEQRSAPGPERLFLSGRGAPAAAPSPHDQVRTDAHVLAAIRRLGGTTGGVFQDPDLLAMVMPALRADYRAIGTYAWTPGAPLNVPFTVLIGDNDPVVTVEEASDWRGFSAARTDLRVFSGGHFYLDHHTREVADLVAEALGVVTVVP